MTSITVSPPLALPASPSHDNREIPMAETVWVSNFTNDLPRPLYRNFTDEECFTEAEMIIRKYNCIQKRQSVKMKLYNPPRKDPALNRETALDYLCDVYDYVVGKIEKWRPSQEKKYGELLKNGQLKRRHQSSFLRRYKHSYHLFGGEISSNKVGTIYPSHMPICSHSKIRHLFLQIKFLRYLRCVQVYGNGKNNGKYHKHAGVHYRKQFGDSPLADWIMKEHMAYGF